MKKNDQTNPKINQQLLKDIRHSMESKSTEELLYIWETNNRAYYSNEAFEVIQQLLIERGQSLSEQPPKRLSLAELKEKSSSKIGGDEELEHYVLEAGGISREKLNLFALIGVFIFGWLITVVFDYLGKKKIGWIYFVCVIASISLGRFAPIFRFGAIAYLIGWIHANSILSAYETSATRRIAELDRKDKSDVNGLIEKGILLSKVLRRKEDANKLFRDALQIQGGDSFLLAVAARVIDDPDLAVTFLNRAQNAELSLRKQQLQS
ncbi:MAG: hypothetical protein DKINENOH_04805 [bacterium]|nr:hypothetical protein [bacterium]